MPDDANQRRTSAMELVSRVEHRSGLRVGSNRRERLGPECLSLFLHNWSAELHVGMSALQALMMPFVLAAAATAPFVGYFADKCPTRWLFGGGLLGITAFCLGISTASSYWQIVMLYTVLLPPALGLSTSITANAVVSRWFVRRLGLALGLTAFGIGMAGVVLPPVVSYAIPQLLGWRAVWRIGGLIVGVFVAPIVVFILRDRPGPQDGLFYLRVDGSAALRPHGHRNDAGPGGLNWLAIIRSTRFWLLVAAFIPILALFGASGNNLVPIVVARGFSRQTAAVVLSIYGFPQVAGSLLMGLLADRLGSRLLFFVCLTIVAATGAVVVAFGERLPVLAAGFLMIGLGGANMRLACLAWLCSARSAAGPPFSRADGALPSGEHRDIIAFSFSVEKETRRKCYGCTALWAVGSHRRRLGRRGGRVCAQAGG
jgi:MFS family permease